MMIPGMLAQGMQSSTSTATAVMPAIRCPKCRAEAEPGARYCGSCGAEFSAMNVCSSCGTEAAAGAKYCPNCGRALDAFVTCRHCGKTLPQGTKYCTGCGKQQNDD
jgi:predicted amidophosphoribosyltransferase